jgi:hypothetical protein
MTQMSPLRRRMIEDMTVCSATIRMEARHPDCRCAGETGKE